MILIYDRGIPSVILISFSGMRPSNLDSSKDRLTNRSVRILGVLGLPIDHIRNDFSPY